MSAIVADRGGVEIAMPIDLRAPNEAGLHLATLEESHEVDRARAPDGARDVRRIAHGVQELGRGLVAHDPQLEEADGIRSVRALRQNEGDERQAHPTNTRSPSRISRAACATMSSPGETSTIPRRKPAARLSATAMTMTCAIALAIAIQIARPVEMSSAERSATIVATSTHSPTTVRVIACSPGTSSKMMRKRGVLAYPSVRASSPQLEFVSFPGKSLTPTMYATHA
jgi:hypothetical protein